jgi:hypothetical protein
VYTRKGQNGLFEHVFLAGVAAKKTASSDDLTHRGMPKIKFLQQRIIGLNV